MAATTITRGQLRRLAEVRSEAGRVISVFQNLDPTEFATPPARATARNSLLTEAARLIEELEDLPHAERTHLREDLERVRETLERPDLTAEGEHTHGIAVFACGAEDLLELVRLPHPVESRVVLNHRPFLEPLTRGGAAERWCVLLANRKQGRIFLGAGEALEETDRIEDDVHSQHDQGGWSQANYQRSVEKEKIDHLDRVSDAVFRRFKRQPFDHLVVGAPEELSNQLVERLHSYLRGRLTARVTIDVENSTAEDVRAAARAVIEEVSRERERRELDRMRQGMGQAQRAAAGLENVQSALEERRVEVLLVADPNDLDPEVVEQLIEMTIEQSAEVLHVRHHDDLRPHGGLCAILRF